MRDIAAAGVDEVVSSWWGQGSPEDLRLGAVIRAARRVKLQVAIQLEPYPGRTVDSVGSDLAYLRGLGIHDVYVYRSNDFQADDWKRVTSQPSGMRLFAQTSRVGFAARAGFAGFYTYDILLYTGAKFERLCEQARAAGILCAPRSARVTRHGRQRETCARSPASTARRTTRCGKRRFAQARISSR